MLVEPSRSPSQLAAGGPIAAAVRASGPWSRVPGVLAFALAAAFLLAYALPGGAYDIVRRQEYAIAVWWVVGIGFAVGLLPRCRPPRLVLVLIGLLLAYAGWTALSLIWTDSSERTTAEVARVLAYAGVLVLVVSALDRSTWRPAAIGLGFAAFAVCGLGVASRLAPSAFPANPFRGLPEADRLSYPFGYWNAVGAWGSMCTALGLAWSAHDPVRARRAVVLALVPVAALATYLSYSRGSAAGSALAVVAVLAFSRNRLTALLHTVAAAAGAGLVILAVRSAPDIANATGSRGAGGVGLALAGACAVAAIVAVLTTVTGCDRRRASRTLTRAAAVAGLVAVLVGGAVFGPRLASRAWHSFRHPASIAPVTDPAARLGTLGGVRYAYWRAALDAFSAKPLTGTGAGTFEFWWDQHGSTGDFIRNAHSLELESMAELGLPGLALIAAFLVVAGALLVRARRHSRRIASAGASAALLAAFLVYVLQASVDWLWQTTAVTVLALAAVGVAAVRLSRRRTRVRWYARAVMAVVAVGAIAVQVPGLLSTLELRRSQSAERSGDAGVALSWADAAVSAEPWAASPYEQRGLVLESAGRLAAATADLGRAIDREPDNFVHWLLLARVQTERGAIPAAERDYARARELRPDALVFQLSGAVPGG